MGAKRDLTAVDDDQLLTPDEVREILQVSHSTLEQWRWLGKGPRWLKVGRHVRYRRVDVRGWIGNGGDSPDQARPA